MVFWVLPSCKSVMKLFSGGRRKLPNAVALVYCRAQPLKESRVPDVSFQPNAPPVTPKSCSPRLLCSKISVPSTLTSSPTQELIADGVMVLTTLQAPPVECSSEISGHISPARAETRTAPDWSGR